MVYGGYHVEKGNGSGRGSWGTLSSLPNGKFGGGPSGVDERNVRTLG